MGLEPTTFSLARRSWVRPFLDEVTEQLALRLMVLVSDQQRVLSLASLAAAKGVDPLDQMRHRDAVRMLRSDVPIERDASARHPLPHFEVAYAMEDVIAVKLARGRNAVLVRRLLNKLTQRPLRLVYLRASPPRRRRCRRSAPLGCCVSVEEPSAVERRCRARRAGNRRLSRVESSDVASARARSWSFSDRSCTVPA